MRPLWKNGRLSQIYKFWWRRPTMFCANELWSLASQSSTRDPRLQRSLKLQLQRTNSSLSLHHNSSHEQFRIAQIITSSHHLFTHHGKLPVLLASPDLQFNRLSQYTREHQLTPPPGNANRSPSWPRNNPLPPNSKISWRAVCPRSS